MTINVPISYMASGTIKSLGKKSNTVFENIVSLGNVAQNTINKYGDIAICVLNTWGSGTYSAGQAFAKIPNDVGLAFDDFYGTCGYTVGGVNYFAPLHVENGNLIVPAPGAYTNIWAYIVAPCKMD